MALATVRQALVDLLSNVSGVENVYPRKRWWRTIDDLPTDSEGRIQWWEVYVAGMRVMPVAYSLACYYYTFQIDGYLAINDETASQNTFEGMVEDVCDAIVSDLDLGGVVQFGNYPDHGQAGTVGLPVVELGVATMSGRSGGLHQCRITLVLRDATERSLQS